MYDNEKIYPNFLKKKEIKNRYIGNRKNFFKLSNTTYTPDFYLPDSKTYIEVVASDLAYEINQHKYNELIKTKKDIKLKFVKPNGSRYIPKDKRKSKKAFMYREIIKFAVNPNIKREFSLICAYRGLKAHLILEKFVIEFNKKNEVKVLQ